MDRQQKATEDSKKRVSRSRSVPFLSFPRLGPPLYITCQQVAAEQRAASGWCNLARPFLSELSMGRLFIVGHPSTALPAYAQGGRAEKGGVGGRAEGRTVGCASMRFNCAYSMQLYYSLRPYAITIGCSIHGIVVHIVPPSHMQLQMPFSSSPAPPDPFLSFSVGLSFSSTLHTSSKQQNRNTARGQLGFASKLPTVLAL